MDIYILVRVLNNSTEIHGKKLCLEFSKVGQNIIWVENSIFWISKGCVPLQSA